MTPQLKFNKSNISYAFFDLMGLKETACLWPSRSVIRQTCLNGWLRSSITIYHMHWPNSKNSGAEMIGSSLKVTLQDVAKSTSLYCVQYCGWADWERLWKASAVCHRHIALTGRFALDFHELRISHPVTG